MAGRLAVLAEMAVLAHWEMFTNFSNTELRRLFSQLIWRGTNLLKFLKLVNFVIFKIGLIKLPKNNPL